MSDRARNLAILVVVLGLLVASVFVIVTKPTKLGLDLQGGVQLVYQAQPTPQQPTVTAEAVQRALDIMRERVDAFGVAEPELQQVGADQLEVNLPGVDDAERAAAQVGSTAQLFFYDWEANVLDADCRPNDTQPNGGQQPVTGLFNAVQRASECPPQRDRNNVESADPRFYAFDRISRRAFNDGLPAESRAAALEDLTAEQRSRARVLKVPEGILVVRDEAAGPNAPEPDRWWIIRDNPALSGTDIRNPEQSFDESAGNQPIVTFEFSDDGRRSFQEITREIAQRGADNALPGTTPDTGSQRFAIVLDNELVSAPIINYRENPDGIDGSTGAQISGSFTPQTAQDLATVLQIGALPLKLDLISRSQVSATLGRQALDQGLIAGLAGFAIVALFLIGYYRALGAIASLTLVIYGIYLLALVKVIPVTMTLPGIAGLVLTIGVAADANIVIFERIKEEVRAGRSTGAAIQAGYRKGITAIVDANIVTLLVAFVLFILATAGVKGFALMLGLGVIVSLFTAVLATQAILYLLRGTRLLRSRSALGAGEQRAKFRYDYMGASKWFFSASGIILLIGALAIAGRGINFGIDFESGTRIIASLERTATVDDVRGALTADGYADAKIQTIDNPELGRNVVQVSTPTLEPPEVDTVNRTLDERFGLAQDPEVTSIGPTFGETVARSALIAIIASLSIISLYIALRFEWKFAVPVLIALMHDILIVSGVYALTGREVTTATVAALLTILGYSLYDTIIVLDRVRENVPRMPSATFSQITNRSLSEVIVRSLVTSFCTLLPVLALMLFGGETLRDFAFALLVGIASGAYSSIFIAMPILSSWKERDPVYETRLRRVRDAFGGTVPAYAVATAGAPVDVAPKERPGRRRSATAPTDPAQGVSGEEFDDMVRNLGVEEEAQPQRAEPAVARTPRPAGGRRARGRTGGNGAGDPSQGTGGGAPEPPGGDPKPRKPRNKRHGRPR